MEIIILNTIYKTNHKYFFLFWLSLILLAAVISRALIFNEFLTDNPFSKAFFSDDWVYWVMAGAKAAGNWIEETPFLSAPLFPYLLGLVRWAGGKLETVFILQMALGLASIVFIALGCKKRFGEITALIAAGLFAFCEEPTMAFTKVMADSIQIFLVCFVWFLWSRLSNEKDNSLSQIFITGLAIGLLVLAWPPSQLLLIGYAAWLFFNTESTLKNKALSSCVGLFAGLLVISPATLHNYQADDEFILVSANSGINFLQGNNKNAQGIITPIDGIRTDRQHMYQDAERVYAEAKGFESGKVDSWKKMDGFYKQQAVDYMLANPEESISLLAKKFYWFLSSQDYDNISVLSLEQEHGLYQWAKIVPVELPWLMGLALLGLVILSKNIKRYAPEILILFVTIFACVLFHYSARYRLPAAPILCILSAVAISQWKTISINPIIKFIIALIPIGFIIFNASTGFTSVDFMRNDTATKISHAYIEAGDLYARSNEHALAEKYYKRAVKADPAYETPYLRLVHLGAKSKQPELVQHWTTQAPSKTNVQPIALKLLFNSQLSNKNYSAASQSLKKMVEASPTDKQLSQKLIWLLTTNPNEESRDSGLAMDLARKLLSASNGNGRIGALVTLATAQLASGNKSSANHSIKKAIKMAQRKGLDESLETLLKLQKDIELKAVFDFDVKPFEVDNPWDLAKPHPMDLLEL